MAGTSKRKISDTIDLTASDEDATPPSKAPRHTATQQQRRGQADDEKDDDEDDGSNELVAATQSVDNDGTLAVQVGQIAGKIVGIQYYDGHASQGETVLVRREPENQYDANAIKVTNVNGVQIGHIPRQLAAKLAPFMDDHSLMVEGMLADAKGVYDCPINLSLYGTSEPAARLELEKRMKDAKLPATTGKRLPKKREEIIPSQRKKLGLKSAVAQGTGKDAVAVPDDEGASLDDLMQAAERYRLRSAEEIAEQWSTPEQALEDLPAAPQPKPISATLLPYQLQGLAWMQKMEQPELPPEGSEEAIQLWRRSKVKDGMWSNIATNFTTKQVPKLARGGILADDMGLGKTLQCISLMAGGQGTTLILAPVSVMSNWSHQIEMHVKESHKLNVLTYHGSNRKRLSQKEFDAYDVVISTYGALSSEYDDGKYSKIKGLFCKRFTRVILDEGHIIRNPSTKVAVAACHLVADSRWILSGTPIVNSVKDLFSMLKFLRITGGLEQLDIFNSIITRPLAAGNPDAESLLQKIMQNLVLRRKKDMKFIDLRLPELSEYIHRVEFRKDEKEKYEALQAEAKGMLEKYQAGVAKKTGEAAGQYRHLLEILLRLRQVCCHWKLVGEERISGVIKLLDASKVVELTDENRQALQTILDLSIQNSEECPICLEDLHNPVITNCKHIFGLECIQRVIEGQHMCPMCRNPLIDETKLVHPREEESDTIKDDGDHDSETSSKIDALMEILTASLKKSTSKVIIFSQWTSALDIIQKQLVRTNLNFTRVDGKMTSKARDAAITQLREAPYCKIMLASLAVCSVGLNLVMADTVVLFDSWWSPAIEDQAVDRVHRLGQTRKCTVWRLVMEESIEERVLDIQKEKRKLVSKAFREKGKGDTAKKSRIGDLERLLQ